ncbi:MAG: bacillithiol biosynthesis cysteine-adding enzyme BshC, partial [Candidatus Zixiibacteriota bacterium]
LIKAMAVAKAAARYEKELKRPVIPIFWIAADDHDFAEVNHVLLLNRKGEPCTITYDDEHQVELPLSEVRLTNEAELQKIKGILVECLGNTDFTDELYAAVNEAYASGETFVTAFARLMARFTRDTGLAVFSPGDAEAKRIAIPFFRRIVEQQETLHRLIESANQRLKAAGYHIQVEKKPDAAYLFYNSNGRKPVQRAGKGFAVGDVEFTTEALLDRINEEPEKFSPDVMTRPVFQSFLFPTISQKGGPAEIAYLAQINALFDVFDLPAPVHRPRPSVTVVERRFETFMKEHKISFEELAGDIEQVVNRVLAETFPHDLEDKFIRLRETVERAFNDFTEETLTFDPSLHDFAHQTFGKIDFAMKNFEGKVFAAHKRKSKDTRERIYRLWYALYPERHLQERGLNVSYFIAKYGFGFLKFLYTSLDSEQTDHQVLYLSEWQDK